MWEEIEGCSTYRQFRMKGKMYLIHIVKYSNKDLYMVVNENAFDLPAPKLIICNASEILSIYGIKL